MFAPGVARMRTYGIKVGPQTLAYMETMMALPAWAEWCEAGRKETWIVAEDEVDWPTVLTA
jgi:glutathione S-transferase